MVRCCVTLPPTAWQQAAIILERTRVGECWELKSVMENTVGFRDSSSHADDVHYSSTVCGVFQE